MQYVPPDTSIPHSRKIIFFTARSRKTPHLNYFRPVERSQRDHNGSWKKVVIFSPPFSVHWYLFLLLFTRTFCTSNIFQIRTAGEAFLVKLDLSTCSVTFSGWKTFRCTRRFLDHSVVCFFSLHDLYKDKFIFIKKSKNICTILMRLDSKLFFLMKL